ncbi:MAG: aminotransferase class V-fold PLP-dependent enzyme [Clostridia bacterium]|nr:aminotransferase class V-fold PLP-dependent enzyme [Clostridia bacterium]
MNTPICDFVNQYANSGTLRCHMPGHKGVGTLGIERRDITEIAGADSLYEADGIIRESEENASQLFGCPTYYSTEGSSQCIRAMLYLVQAYAKECGKAPLILAARNAHKTFLSAVALLDLPVSWLPVTKQDSYLSCRVDASELDRHLTSCTAKPVALYLTSPDYLGTVSDIRAIAAVCHRHGVKLLVDNAHGAYLKFLPHSEHPIDLGADLACDSAHKTLPVLTGGAYLHVAKNAPACFSALAKNALALFGSTSPSYLILQSLDAANAYLHELFPKQLADFLPIACGLRDTLCAHGFHCVGDEALKLTVRTKPYGYLGTHLSALLRERGIECELADPDYVVLMLTPTLGADALTHLREAFCSIPPKAPIEEAPPAPVRGTPRMSVRDAMLAPAEILPTKASVGRILAAPSVSCPPAIPILLCGEEITQDVIDVMLYYGIKTCPVVK